MYQPKTIPDPPSSFSIGDLNVIETLVTLDREVCSQSCDVAQDLNINPLHLNLKELKSKSKFTPQLPADNVIETFNQALTQDIHSYLDKLVVSHKNKISNLTTKQRKALQNLAKDPSIVIKEADKGGNIVILNTFDYITMGCKHLHTPGCYETLDSNPVKRVITGLLELIDIWYQRGFLTDDEKHFLSNTNPTIPTMYFLPKIHKPFETLPEVRPIMSGINWATEGLSKYLDEALKPFVIQMPSYIRDSTHILQSLQDIIWEPDYLLATIDVVALYTNINHDLALQTIDYVFRNTSASYSDHVSMLKQFLQFVLGNNMFIFNDQFYLQVRGVAMGAKFAPSLANLFMSFYEETHILNQVQFVSNIVMWRRYIDDIFLIWKGSEDSFTTFLGHANTNRFGIRLIGLLNSCEIDFLDLHIFVVGNTVLTNTFRKPTESAPADLHCTIMADYMSNRDKDRAALFAPRGSTENPFKRNSSAPETLKQKFIKLERLSKKEINKYWEQASLTNYLENNLIPRGLRILTFPNFDHEEDADLAEQWVDNLNQSSKHMLELLILHATREHKRVLTKIQVIKEEISQMPNAEETKHKNFEKMNEILVEYQDEIKLRKFRKYFRDDKDYRQDRVYTFQPKYDDINTHSKPPSITTTPASSDPDSETEPIESDANEAQPGVTPNLKGQLFLGEIRRYKKGNIRFANTKQVRFTKHPTVFTPTMPSTPGAGGGVSGSGSGSSDEDITRLGISTRSKKRLGL
ncbi:uncharacterized protein [Ambystoma mexicanum]|uniref:uncharacterized protein n=1 Tax=Ambystoma mexicanum TaxID=8296 RepID=UPI0037E8ADDA